MRKKGLVLSLLSVTVLLFSHATRRWLMSIILLAFCLIQVSGVRALANDFILFNKQTTPLNDLRLTMPDGSNETLVLESDKLLMNRLVRAVPSWSRDGTRIILAGTDPLAGEDASPQIFILDPDGNLTQVTDYAPGDKAWPFYARFSPDGTQVIHQLYQSTESVVFIVGLNLDGSPFPYGAPGCGGIPGILLCGDLSSMGVGVDWSPVERLVAVSIKPIFEAAIFVVDPYNPLSNIGRQVSSPGMFAFDWYPSFSPDGKQIAFVRKTTVDPILGTLTSSIWIANADGSGEFQVVSDRPVGQSIDRVSWSPSGDKLIYDMGESILGEAISGASDLFIVDIGTSSIEKVPNATPALNPDWGGQGWSTTGVGASRPTITISSNKNSYSPGDAFSLSWSISNPTSTTRIVDIFLGIIAPGGSIYFFDSSLNNLVLANINDSKTFTPARSSLELSPGYDMPLTAFFSVTLPPGLPEGTYQAFAAFAEPGSVQSGAPRIVGDISISSFTYSP